MTLAVCPNTNKSSAVEQATSPWNHGPGYDLLLRKSGEPREHVGGEVQLVRRCGVCRGKRRVLDGAAVMKSQSAVRDLCPETEFVLAPRR